MTLEDKRKRKQDIVWMRTKNCIACVIILCLSSFVTSPFWERCHNAIMSRYGDSIAVTIPIVFPYLHWPIPLLSSLTRLPTMWTCCWLGLMRQTARGSTTWITCLLWPRPPSPPTATEHTSPCLSSTATTDQVGSLSLSLSTSFTVSLFYWPLYLSLPFLLFLPPSLTIFCSIPLVGFPYSLSQHSNGI